MSKTLEAVYKGQISELTKQRDTLDAALAIIARKRTTHLRSSQMQECINEQKQSARNALADIGEDW